MRKFDYFLFDNYDNSEIKEERDNPRLLLNESVDVILNEIIDNKIGETTYVKLCDEFTKIKIDNLINIGLLKAENKAILIDMPIFIDEDAELLENTIYNHISEALSSDDLIKSLYCNKHGVNKKEIYNELYHVLFGQINERLVDLNFVESPTAYKNQGRYLKSIELY